MHGEFMLVNNGKMSKSLGNTYTLDELESRGYEPLVFRYFCLNGHYRNKLNFTFEGMDAAKAALSNLRSAVSAHRGASDEVSDEEMAAFLSAFEDAINDDLNIPKAFGIVWNMARSHKKSQKLYDLIMRCDNILALDLDRAPEAKPAQEEPDIDAEIAALIERRQEARKAKNFAEADRIRDELKARGIALIDTPQGVRWEKA